MKSIFLGNEYDINRVYTKEIKEQLAEKAGLILEIYTKEDVINQKINTNDVECIFSTWGMPVFTEEEIKGHFSSLKAVFYAAGTVQAFAPAFLNCGVRVFSAWAANGVPVAEYTVAQIILANKGYYKTSALASLSHSKYYEAKGYINKYIGNYDAKIGIIGAGMIGKMVIEKLSSMKYEILVFDPFLPDEKAEELGITKTSLEEIFAKCNVVSNHLANNAQTKNMINRKHFEKMVPYATFINTGRGAQIVEQDLIDVLEERKDIVAILDVTEPEPPVEDNKFYELENCILTPHIAGSSGNEVHRMAEYMKAEFELYKNGKKCNFEVTSQMLKTMA